MGMNETWIFLELFFPDAFNRKMSLEEAPDYVLPRKLTLIGVKTSVTPYVWPFIGVITNTSTEN